MSDTRRPRKPGEVSSSRGGTEEMPDMDDLALWYALNQQMTNYWADVDYNGGSRGARVLFARGAFPGRQQPVRRSGKNPRLLCSAAKARHHHASLGRQSSGTPGRCVLCMGHAIESATARCRRARIGLRNPRSWRAVLPTERVGGRRRGRGSLPRVTLRPNFVGSDRPASISIDPQRL